MKKLMAVVAIWMGCIGLTGCVDVNGPDNGDDGNGDANSNGVQAEISEMRRFASEEEFVSYLQDQATIQERGFGATDDLAVAEDGDSMAGGDAGGEPVAAPTAGDADQSNSAALGESSGNGENDFSTTTEQEEGVQEADVIKNDGEYIYVLSRGVMRIVRATPAGAMEELGSVELDGYGSDLFLRGDQVIALTRPDPVYQTGLAEPAIDGLIFAPWFYRPQTEISVINVADRANPSVETSAIITSDLNTSRLIGDDLYAVFTNYPDSIIRTIDAETGEPKFEQVDVSEYLPKITVERNGEVVFEGNLADIEDFYRPAEPDGLGFATVANFNVNALESFSARSVVGYPANIYSSTDALYLTNTEYSYDGEQRTTTTIYKFAYTDQGPVLTAGGEVPGRVLNQYSMGEYKGYLRVATTIDARWDFEGQQDESSNNVYVLEQNGENLSIAGRLEGLAPGESIYAARFIGDRGFLVTFVQVDPLFTLDMSDPTNPQVVGELKVPGFSTFIQPVDDNTLLTIGQATNLTEQGFVLSEGVQLSIFDVTDFAAPVLLHSEVIGTNGTYSEALYNPKAFTWYPQRNALALPVEMYQYFDFGGPAIDVMVDEDGSVSGGSEGSSGDGEANATDDEEQGAGGDSTEPGDPDDQGDDMDGDEPVDPVEPRPEPLPEPIGESFIGVYVYTYSLEGGFEFSGRISTQPDDEEYFRYPAFTRGVFIGDMVYAVTSESVQAADLADVESVLSAVEFPIPESDRPMPVDLGAAVSSGGVDTATVTEELED